MSDDERIEQLELVNKVLQCNNKELKAKIDELQKELDKKDKVISLMANGLNLFSAYNCNPKQIIEKFEKKVEEENDD